LNPILRTFARPAARLGAAAQNALEVARFGGLETDEESSPYEVVTDQPVYRLRRYFAGTDASGKPPLLLIPPLMLAADVYDVSPSATAVGLLHAAGVDPWVVDFGSPEHEEGGLKRTLTDHVLAVDDAITRVKKSVGRDIHIGGYSQGGMFCYQVAAYRQSEGIASAITFGSPVDTSGAMPFGIPEQVASGMADVLTGVLNRASPPAWMVRQGFRFLDPVKSLRQRIDFVRQLHNREALLPRERQRRFLQADGWVAYPGPAAAELVQQFIVQNRMLSGGFVIHDRSVTLADITCPVLCFVGEVDEIAPAQMVRAITQAAPRAEIYERSLRAGHFGLVVGTAANETTWPVVAEWVDWVDSGAKGNLPAHVVPAAGPDAGERRPPSLAARVGHGLGLTTGVSAGFVRSGARTATRTVSALRQLSGEALDQLPRLARLEGVRPTTRISLGLLMDEHASKSPDQVFFLFDDRAYSQRAVKERIDNVVHGLIEIGVRQGEHVGVLMGPRPSGWSVVAALSRLGAVAVLMRPDGEIGREAELGGVTRLIADPELGPLALDQTDVPVYVLGGGGEERELAPGLVDMERIDPDRVQVPGWYLPNPGRARDLAFIVFTGGGESLRLSRITNARWAISAFGTASAAALTESDTVYSLTPIYHPSGLLMSIGGAVVSGARIALASSFEPATFWDEVRRYGVTVASYTWTMLHDLAEAPPDPLERHHPIRIFMGSGMPRGLWRRVSDRFSPARVLEFYASTEADTVLVNLAGTKPGSMGRPLPGSSEVRIAEYDAEAQRLVLGADGFARECPVGEAGMLLSRVRPDLISTSALPLRGLFKPDDAWLATGDLFRQDEDGDFWLVGSVPALIRTTTGMVAPRRIENALSDIDGVDLVVAYGVPDGDAELAVAAVTLRKGRELEATEVTLALERLEPDQRPAFVRVVDEIPVTTWYRPLSRELREEGISPGMDGIFERTGDGTYAVREKVPA
jgi:putative long chain acyl-CoA synthase